MFITFEGVEACGKSTQASLLHKYFQEKQIKSFLTREPGGFAFGEKIREILLHDRNIELSHKSALLLFSAVRSEHCAKYILPKLQDDYQVICDRFIDSSMVYQSFAGDLSRESVIWLNTFSTGSLMPDVTFYLRIDFEESQKRLQGQEKDKIELASSEYHRKLIAGFDDLAAREPNRVVVLDGHLPVVEIHQRVLRFLKNKKEISLKFKEGN